MLKAIFVKYLRGCLTSPLNSLILYESSTIVMASLITYELKKTLRPTFPISTFLCTSSSYLQLPVVYSLQYSLHPWYFKQNYSFPLTNPKPSLTGLYILGTSVLQDILSHKLVVITDSLPLSLSHTLYRSFTLLVLPSQALTFLPVTSFT